MFKPLEGVPNRYCAYPYLKGKLLDIKGVPVFQLSGNEFGFKIRINLIAEALFITQLCHLK
jgi:hypothetical protein